MLSSIQEEKVVHAKVRISVLALLKLCFVLTNALVLRERIEILQVNDKTELCE